MSDQLLRLRQGDFTISDYTLQFCTLAAASGWNEAAPRSSYHHGLNPIIRTAISIYDDKIGLESIMQRATRISQCFLACQPNEAAHQLVYPAFSPSVPEPMQFDSTLLTRSWTRLRPDSTTTVPQLIASSRTVPSHPTPPHALR